MKLEKIRKVYLLLFVLAVILTFSQLASAAQAPPTLTVGNIAGFPGDQVVIPIKITGATSMDSFNMEVLYDPQVLQPGADGLGYVDRTGTLTANYDLFVVNAAVPGEVQIGAATMTPAVSNGILMNLLFTIKPDASGSSLVNLSLLDDPGNDLRNSRVIAGTVTVAVQPIVTATTPEDTEGNVPLNAQVTATFNKDMNPMTINRGTFTIKDQRNAEVPGTVTYNNKTATYKPSRTLNPNTTYTATLTTRITDLARNTLPTNYAWQFTTEPPDLRTPEITATTPENNQSNISLSTQITATFNKDMNPMTINRGTFTIKDQRNAEVPGSITYNNKTATYKPSRTLNPDTTYTATLTTRITDLNRQTLPISYVWRFTTL